MFSTYGADDEIWPMSTAKIIYFIHAILCRTVNIYSTANFINNPMKLPQKCDIFYISHKQQNMDNLNSRNKISCMHNLCRIVDISNVKIV